MVTLLSSCASLTPLVELDGVKTSGLDGLKIRSLGHTTGAVDGSYYSGAYTKISKFHFDEAMQAEFMALLARELKAAGAVLNSDDLGAVRVIVHFDETFYESNSSIYTLDVNMDVHQSHEPTRYTYRIKSSDGMGFFKANFGSSVDEQRLRAAQMLLEAIIEDLANHRVGISY